MRVTIDETFTVNASPDTVWQVLQNPHNVVPCIPGARITETSSENTYLGTVTMKMGPLSVRFSGEVRMTEIDQNARALTLEGTGRDVKGKGNALMRLEGSVQECHDGSAAVTTRMTLSIRGRLAQFGARLIRDVSKRVFNQFVACFQECLQKTDATATTHSGSTKIDAEIP